MFGFELQEFMLKDPYIRRYYGGVIALDEIPKVKVSNKTVYIVNTDPSYKKGQHWILIWYHDIPKYFDPLAHFPSSQMQEILFLKKSAFYRSAPQVQPSLENIACFTPTIGPEVTAWKRLWKSFIHPALNLMI